MNYVEINGVNSKYIEGLLIQELPPIKKPKMRTSIEEIDGKDGDIITELGYSAYDKPLKIGLFGDYDIDAVIEYFNTEGTIIFSNEPDKVYNFKALDEVDFERLMRFRTADVKLHVQPFKYSAIDGALTAQGNAQSINVTNRGNIYSRPTVEIKGSGLVTVSLNGIAILKISMPDSGDITINTEQLEAYNDSGYQNRRVNGDYSKFILHRGKNIIAWDGNVNEIQLSKYSRWI